MKSLQIFDTLRLQTYAWCHFKAKCPWPNDLRFEEIEGKSQTEYIDRQFLICQEILPSPGGVFWSILKYNKIW